MSKKDKNYIENYIKECVQEEIEQLEHDFFSKDLMDYIKQVISNKFIEYLKSGEWKNDIDLYVEKETYLSVKKAISDWVNKDLIIEEAQNHISYELRATIKDLKSLKEDIADGCLQKLFYDKVAKPEEQINDIAKQVFRMQSDIANLREEIMIFKRNVSRKKLNDFG